MYKMFEKQNIAAWLLLLDVMLSLTETCEMDIVLITHYMEVGMKCVKIRAGNMKTKPMQSL